MDIYNNIGEDGSPSTPSNNAANDEYTINSFTNIGNTVQRENCDNNSPYEGSESEHCRPGFENGTGTV